MTLDSDRNNYWHHFPRSVFFLVVFTAIFLLFFGAFSVPYIDFIYFVKAARISFDDSVTLGSFGFCYESAGSTTCSPGITGYQFGSDPPLISTVSPLPVIPAAFTRALLLHVVAFVISLVTATLVLCSTWDWGHNLIAQHIIYPILVLIFFNLASFVADLLLLTHVKKAFGETAVVSIGNGTWLTFVSLLLLLVIVPFRPRPTRSSSQDIENRESFGNWGAQEYPREQKLDDTHSQQDKERATIQEKLSIRTTHSHSSHNNARSDTAPQSAVSASNQQMVLSPIRRTDIQINVIPTEPDSPHQATNPILGAILERDHTSQSSEERTISGYAPSVYSTCLSDGSHLTPTTLSRASSSAFHGGQRPARRSSVNPHAIEHWFFSGAGSHARMVRMGSRKRSRLDSFSNSTVSSPSPAGSMFNGSMAPSFPSPPPFSLQFRDRFIENNPSIPLDTRSFVSAVPSSDIELDVQTVAASTPRRLSFAHLSPLPVHHLDPDEISLA